MEESLKRLEKAITDSIDSIDNYIVCVEDIQDYLEGIEDFIPQYNFDKIDFEIENLNKSIDFLKYIMFRKIKLIKHIRLNFKKEA